MEVFRYIAKPNREHHPEDVMENKYKTLDSIAKKQIIFDHSECRYLVFDTIDGMARHVNSAKVGYFHEVIFGQLPQKIKIDIDGDRARVMELRLPALETGDINDFGEPSNLNDPPTIPANVAAKMAVAITADPEFEARCVYVLSATIRALRTAFFITYQMDLRDDQIIVCQSIIPPGTDTIETNKCSFHVIIDSFHVCNNDQANEFTIQLARLMPEPVRKFLDMGVNKSKQNFRLAGCAKKPGKSAIKTILSDHTFVQTLITNTADTQALPEIDVSGTRPQAEGGAVTDMVASNMHPDDLENVLRLCREDGVTKNHTFRRRRGDTLIFNRDRPSFCEFCNRVHDSDNTVRIGMQREGNLIRVFKACWHDVNKRSIMIGEFESNIAPVAVLPQNEDEQRRLLGVNTRITDWAERTIVNSVRVVGNGGDLFPKRTLFDDLAAEHKNIYSEPQLRPFELSRTLCVQAHMKMGKTKALLDYINKYFDSKLTPPIIRIISFRQTFSGNLKEKFADFTLYSDVQGPLVQRKLIVQVESLHRLAILENSAAPDLVVLDECESIFEQFGSGLAKSFSGAFRAFEWLLRYSRHVICMDANLGDRTFRTLDRMRPGFRAEDAGIVYHRNLHQNAREDTYYFTADKLRWYGLLYTAVTGDERIAVPMSSRTEAKVLERNLRRKFPNKSIKLYSSETTQTEKRDHFANVNLHWSQYDVLIYTPTVSAGVSFELPHFHKVFGYFTDQSCPVETCVQMIGRIRDVGTRQYYICVSATGNTLPVDIDQITGFAHMRRENLVKVLSESMLSFEYQENGEILVHNQGGNYFYLWAENVRMRNLSYNSFIRRIVHVISLCGASMRHLDEAVYAENTGFEIMVEGEINADLAEIKAMHEIAKVEIKEQEFQNIVDAEELTDEEAEEIALKRRAETEITPAQRYAYEKYRMRQDYNYPFDPEGRYNVIDRKFVATYFSYDVRRIYRNICRVSACDTIEEAVRRIQQEELAVDRHISEYDENAQQFFVNRRNVFEKHRLALGLLKACGWQNLSDPRNLHIDSLAENIAEAQNEIVGNFETIRAEFQRIRLPSIREIVNSRADNAKYIKTMVDGIINKVLETVYGVRIGTRAREKDMYMLHENTKFALSLDSSNGRPIIRKV